MIPSVDDVRSAPLTHRIGDLFNPPALTNRIGCVQAEVDVTAIRSLSFPPFGAGDIATASLFLNDRLFPSFGAPVTFTWQPDCIVRESFVEGLELRSVTALAVGERAALVRLEVSNATGMARDVSVRLGLRSGVTRQDEAWLEPLPPFAATHDVNVSTDGIVVHTDTAAASAQGALPVADEMTPTSLGWRARLRPGEALTIRFVAAYGSTGDEAAEIVRRLTRDHDAAFEAARNDWNEELRAVFTPGNDRYGGSLPVLETGDEDIQRAWLSGILGVVMFRRESPVLGRSYDTLMPRYWQTVTFLWDYGLSSLVHSLLDPAVMRAHMEHWMTTDVHSCFGTDRMTGGPVGGWYSVNDYIMTRMISDYVRWTGDTAWLDSSVAGKPVADHLNAFATNWERFRTPSGLADYGGIGNLLECVSTYVHEIAALNASNVWSMRFAAEVAEARGLDGSSLRDSADDLCKKVRELYVEGKGFWNARYPDGSLVPVRHCYDFITVLTTIADDLSEQQRDEMTTFFERELQTPLWMHALSPADPDALFSIRPDHQWNGAYPAWPPLAVLGLLNAGKDKLAVEWLRGLGRSANQGPYGQAHFAENVVPADSGGAPKAPSETPYITDWAVSSGGAWVSAIVEGLFGVDAGLGGLTAAPRLETFDADARLRNLPYRGTLYDVDASGVHEAKP